jgi:hypothetical protein
MLIVSTPKKATHDWDQLKAGMLRTGDFLVKVPCFVKDPSNIFNIKISRPRLVSARRSTVLSLSLQFGFPAEIHHCL